MIDFPRFCHHSLVLFVCFALFGNATKLKEDEIIISTDLGKIKGNVHVDEIDSTPIYSFVGIQYADSPIGDLRFRQAQLNETKWNGTYDGTTFGNTCMQDPLLAPAGQSVGEDCLFLNIWTPYPLTNVTTTSTTTTSSKKTSSSSSSSNLLPVMVWIYGGGFTVGSSSAFYYNGMSLVRHSNNKVLFISLNYRLAIFGFLQNELLYNEDSTFTSYGGQNGVYDQIIALKWIQKYIESFGGDPNQVTIFGESAGGLSICNLLISPLATGLFERAIIESGACVGGWGVANTTWGLKAWNNLLINAGLPYNNLTYLRSLTAQELYDKMPLKPIVWQGSVDGLVLTSKPVDIYNDISTDKLNAKKIIIGINTMDSVASYPWHLARRPGDNDSYWEYWNYYIPNNKTQVNLLGNYYYQAINDFPMYRDHNSYELSWFTVMADCCLTCTTLNIANNIAIANDGNDDDDDVNLYVYQFGGPGINGSDYYAPHGSELPFVFFKPPENDVFQMPWSETLSKSIMSAWTNFAIHSLPNITLTNEDIIVWDEYNTTTNSVLFFRDSVYNKANFDSTYRRDVCTFWYDQVGIGIMDHICNGRLL